MFEKNMHITFLLDFYGNVLADRTRELLEMYYFDDMSLSEIAEELGQTRQAVHYTLRKAEKAHESYEEKLGLAARYRALGDAAQRCLDALNRVQGSDGDDAHLSEARLALENIINER